MRVLAVYTTVTTVYLNTLPVTLNTTCVTCLIFNDVVETMIPLYYSESRQI